MKPRAFTVILRLDNCRFFQPTLFSDFIGKSIVEAWFFGQCENEFDERMRDQARIACSRLPAHLIHQVQPSPIQDFSEVATTEEAREILTETLTQMKKLP